MKRAGTIFCAFAAMIACGVACGGTCLARPWEGAKWIGAAAEFCPDEDFGAAEWITVDDVDTGDTLLEKSFDCPVDSAARPIEAVFTGTPDYEIYINGKCFYKWTGHVRDCRCLVYRDLRPWLTAGKNTVQVKIRGEGERAFIAKAVLGDGRNIGTGCDWTSPDGAVRVLGRMCDTDFGKTVKLRTETRSSAFAKSFSVAGKPKSAVLEITGVGFYEAYLNGKKVGDKVLDPSPTDYDKSVLYSTYDVSASIRDGENELMILLGHGWYDNRSVATWNFETAPWRNFPCTIARLEVTDSAGAIHDVVTDSSWRHVVNPVLYDDIYEGEVVDGRLQMGMSLPGEVKFAAEVTGPRGALRPELQPGAKVMGEFAAKSVKKLDDGAYLIEFPVNLSGWMRLVINGQKPGDVVSLRYDERTGEKRRIDEHFRSTASHRFCATDAAFQCDRYICRGEDGEVYEPRFSYKGFKYVLVRGLRTAPKPGDAVAKFVHTAFRTIGSFDCSDATFNMLVEMGIRSYKCNFTDGVPTDCPHREKNGWTGDASIASELAQYLFDNTAGYEKWLRDIVDAQLPDGNIPDIVPTSGWGFKWGNGPAWNSALPVIAWNLWVYRGDRAVLDEVYPALKKYLGYVAAKADADGLVSYGLGDWVSVNPKHSPSLGFTSSCYYYQALRIASEMAKVLGLSEDAAEFGRIATKTRDGIRNRFMKDDGVFDNGGQTAQGMALAFGVVDEPERSVAERQLILSVERADGHVDMGLLGMKHVFRALSRAGRTDLAWKMLTNPTAPSPVEWIQKGGTTLWEDWDDGFSRNHIMFGDFVGWAFQYLAGIAIEEAPGSTSAVTLPTEAGFRRVTIKPVLLDELNHLSASTEVLGGKLAVRWNRNGVAVEVQVDVPAGVDAKLVLPGKDPVKCPRGRSIWSVVQDVRLTTKEQSKQPKKGKSP